jgi:hypothetical protein
MAISCLVPDEGFADPGADAPFAGTVPGAADGGRSAEEPAEPASAGGTFVVVGCSLVSEDGSSVADFESVFVCDLSAALFESFVDGFESSDEAHPKPTAVKTPNVPTNIPIRVLLVITISATGTS